MAESETSAGSQPIVQPRLVRFLKNRRKLLGGSFRDDFWKEVENNITERRKPDTMAERTVDRLLNEVRDASKPVARNRVRDRLEQGNRTVLRDV